MTSLNLNIKNCYEIRVGVPTEGENEYMEWNLQT